MLVLHVKQNPSEVTGPKLLRAADVTFELAGNSHVDIPDANINKKNSWPQTDPSFRAPALALYKSTMASTAPLVYTRRFI